jgi:predicted O-methyltransferase YrrM
MDFVPPIYSDLAKEEWEIVWQWYEETDRSGEIGECAVPLVSLLQGLILGNRVSRMVQLGTCSGYSAILLGFMLRRMGAERGLFSLDINPELCALTRRWLSCWPNEYVTARGQFAQPAVTGCAGNFPNEWS